MTGTDTSTTGGGGVSFMVLYEDESVDVRYGNGAHLQLSPCGCEFVLVRPAADPSGHPLQPAERVRQRSRFTISTYKELMVTALTFRNKYASRLYLPEEIIPADHKKVPRAFSSPSNHVLMKMSASVFFCLLQPFSSIDSDVLWPEVSSRDAEFGPGGRDHHQVGGGASRVDAVALGGRIFSRVHVRPQSESDSAPEHAGWPGQSAAEVGYQSTSVGPASLLQRCRPRLVLPSLLGSPSLDGSSLILSGAVTVVEISPGDGSVIRSNSVLNTYFTHHKPELVSGQVNEVTYHLSNLPPDVPGQLYSICSIVSRASRILTCYNEAKQSLKLPATPSCLQEGFHCSKPAMIEENLSNRVSAEHHVNVRETAESRSDLVAAELEKIKRFNFLLENNHLLRTEKRCAEPERSHAEEAAHEAVNEDCIAEALRRTSKAIEDIDALISATTLT
ncbi:protein C5orf34-like protein [Nibea albiflora]|uniref:Protein C5orf34-like protein n=1 Tax=Nibea albiflora TaxID=240163 RepID=A0ACB7FDF1_NIBAL|nr:protein C5orf34-like protein [Nibea albiflora]